MNENQTSTLLMATQLILYCGGWVLCAFRVHETRPLSSYFAVFCGLGGVALCLISLRTALPGYLTDVGGQVFTVLTLCCLWMSLDRSAGHHQLSQARWLGAAMVCAVVMLMGLDAELNSHRIVFLYCAELVMLLGILTSARLALRRAHRAILIWPVLLAVVLLAVAISHRAVEVWVTQPSYANMDVPSTGTTLLLWGILFGFSVFNLVFAYVIIADLVNKLYVQGRLDGLTNLLNRRAFNEVLDKEWNRQARHAGGYSLVTFDVDHFKQVNDTYGHALGDKVLHQLASIASTYARQSDYVARIGGEEFVMLLPTTKVDGALLMADRLREAVMRVSWPHGELITISVGVAQAQTTDKEAGDIFMRADQAMYHAKKLGRNRTEVYSADMAAPLEAAAKPVIDRPRVVGKFAMP